MGAGEVGGIGFYNYDSFSLETKHGWMQTGYGGRAAHAFGEALAQLSADFAATDDNIGQGFMRRRLPEWTGQAAQGANEALDAVSVAVAGSGRTGQAGGGSADEYGISFTNTKNQIPEPPSRSLGGALAGPDASGFAAKGAKLAGPVGGAIGYGAGAAVDWVKEQMAYHQADQRVPGYPRPPVNQGESLGSGAGAGAATSAERGAGGLPMGGMGAGAGAQEREHRNKTFIPDDSPFRFTDEELGVVPAVITADNLDDFL